MTKTQILNRLYCSQIQNNDLLFPLYSFTYLITGRSGLSLRNANSIRCNTVGILNPIPFKFPNLILDLVYTIHAKLCKKIMFFTVFQPCQLSICSAIMQVQTCCAISLLLKSLLPQPLGMLGQYNERNFGEKCQFLNTIAHLVSNDLTAMTAEKRETDLDQKAELTKEINSASQPPKLQRRRAKVAR